MTLRISVLLICCLLGNGVHASSFYERIGDWQVIQFHKSFDPERSHHKCSAANVSGDYAILVEVHRGAALDGTLDDGSLILKFFSPDLTALPSEDFSHIVSVLVDERKVFEKTGAPLQIKTTVSDGDLAQNVSALMFAEPGGPYEAWTAPPKSTTYPSAPENKSIKLLNGAWISLSRSETDRILRGQSTLQIERYLPKFSIDEFKEVFDSTKTCNFQALHSEFTQNRLSDIDPHSPFHLILGDEPSDSLTFEKFQNLALKYINEESIVANTESIEMLSDEQISVALRGSTQFAWQGRSGGFGSVSFHPFDYDTERHRLYLGNIRSCVSANGQLLIDNPLTLRIWNDVFVTRAMFCGSVNGDPNLHYIHHTKTSYDFVGGDALVLNEAIKLNGSQEDALAQWDMFVGVLRQRNLINLDRQAEPALPFDRLAGDLVTAGMSTENVEFLSSGGSRCAAAINVGIRYDLFKGELGKVVIGAYRRLQPLSIAKHHDRNLTGPDRITDIQLSYKKAAVDQYLYELDYYTWLTSINVDTKKSDSNHPFVKEIMSCLNASEALPQ